MSRSLAIGGCLLLCALNSTAQPNVDTCKSPMEAKASYLDKVNKAAASLRGSKEFVEAFRSVSAKAAGVRWTCSKDNEDTCCEHIPLTLLTDADGTVCAVSFPYGELHVKRDQGNFKPWLTWEIQQKVTSPPAYEFGSAGIEPSQHAMQPLAVEKSGPDKCKFAPGGRHDAFTCKDNGKKNAAADHVANVYPAAHLDEPNYRCGNVDPTIYNVD